MPFADFDFHTSGSVVFSNDTGDILLGNASLKGVIAGSGMKVYNAHVNAASNRLFGFSRGELRSLLRIDTGTTGYSIGFSALQSQENITGSGAAYVCLLTNGVLQLGKISNGLLNSITVLQEISLDSLVLDMGTIFVMEFSWYADLAQLHGTRLTAALSIEDSVMPPVLLDITDGTSPLTTGAMEGLCGRFETGDIGTIWYDSTYMYGV